MSKDFTDCQGVTLMEIIIALGLSVLLGGVLYQFTSHSTHRYKQNMQQEEMQKDMLMCLKHLRSDLGHIREHREADPRFGQREIPNFYSLEPDSLAFATVRGEKVTYVFKGDSQAITRISEPLSRNEQTIPELIWKKVQERADDTFSMVSSEIQNQVNEQIEGFKSVFDLGDPEQMAQNPTVLIEKCNEVFDKIVYYTGKDGEKPQFVDDLKNTIENRAQEMATEIGYDIESDAEEIMGTVLTKFFELESMAPPRMLHPRSSQREFSLSGSYKIVLADGTEKAPSELRETDNKNIVGFRIFLSSAKPVSSLEQFYKKQGILFIPNGLLVKSANGKSQWRNNTSPRVKLKVMDIITNNELESRYFGEAIIPDADILYRTWVEIPEFWFLDIFNTEKEIEKLRKGFIKPNEAEPQIQ